MDMAANVEAATVANAAPCDAVPSAIPSQAVTTSGDGADRKREAATVANTAPSDADANAAPSQTVTTSGDGADRKRPATLAEGHGDAKRRRLDFSIGDRGVFYTTVSPGKAHDARRDLVRLLEDSLEEPAAVAPAGVASTSAGTVVGGSAATGASSSSKLDAEIKQLRERKERFITCGQEVAKGTGFVKFAGSAVSLVPSDVVARVLQAQKAEFQATHAAPSSRLLCRVLPVDHTCKPFLEDFRKLAKEVLRPHLGEEATPTVWALEFKARNTTTLKKEAVLSVIDDLVSKERHKVNLNDPEKCILVEVNPLFCGLSVLPRWAELKKYNLHALTSTEANSGTTPAVPPEASLPQAGDVNARSAKSCPEETSPREQTQPLKSVDEAAPVAAALTVVTAQGDVAV